eukprot:3997056-Prorocentrum_lima.AAC.1
MQRKPLRAGAAGAKHVTSTQQACRANKGGGRTRAAAFCMRMRHAYCTVRAMHARSLWCGGKLPA